MRMIHTLLSIFIAGIVLVGCSAGPPASNSSAASAAPTAANSEANSSSEPDREPMYVTTCEHCGRDESEVFQVTTGYTGPIEQPCAHGLEGIDHQFSRTKVYQAKCRICGYMSSWGETEEWVECANEASSAETI